ncbi:MAG TPA: hypothetical protein VHJ78_08750, partial [Actinomycetota bacterium]|nr:hypothetical protein [Actinomycetota bacterium]
MTMRLSVVVWAGLALLLFAAVPATAAEFRAGEGQQDVSGPIDDDLYVAGDEVTVSGEVAGDVFAAG